MNTVTKLKVLFLCTGNSCRSQMAEAWARSLKGNVIEAYSAGTSPKSVDPRAVRAMAEAGVDISQQHAKSVGQLGDIEFDYVITLCDDAQRTWPFFPAKTAVVHHGFYDPSRLAEDAKDEEEAMRHYRRVRDEIKAYIEILPDCLDEEGGGLKAIPQPVPCQYDPVSLLSFGGGGRRSAASRSCAHSIIGSLNAHGI